jgi:hypothetical protein
MAMRFSTLLIIFFISSSMSFAKPMEFTSRKWEDQKGRKMDAALVSVQQNGVVVRSNDSKIWLLPVETLSDKDSAYIEGLTDENRRQGKSLDAKVDTTFSVIRKLSTPSQLVTTSEVSGLGGFVKKRIPGTYVVLFSGNYTKFVYKYRLMDSDYAKLSVGQDVGINELDKFGVIGMPRFKGLRSGLVVVRAEYGAGETWKDVSEIIESSVNSGATSFRVGNDTLGGDPVPGQVKSLRFSLGGPLGLDEKSYPEGSTIVLE